MYLYVLDFTITGMIPFRIPAVFVAVDTPLRDLWHYGFVGRSSSAGSLIEGLDGTTFD